jgi:3-hydroxyacyl-CoA dehydrogenase
VIIRVAKEVGSPILADAVAFALQFEGRKSLAADVIIASSSSGLTMSEIQSGCGAHPERCVIGHPFNPRHLMPLVEIVGGAKTSEDTIERVTEFYKAMGKRPVRLHEELPGHVANRPASPDAAL